MKTVSQHKYQHLGAVYRLIDQFELISRTDLSKLSGFAPAAITSYTKSLIDHQFVLERSVQDNHSRGRPAIGLAVSHLHWQLLCVTISPTQLEIALCGLDGNARCQQHIALQPEQYPQLEQYLLSALHHFFHRHQVNQQHLLALSISVIGRLNAARDTLIELGHQALHCELLAHLRHYFSQPILLNEHFQLWLLAESTLGSLIADEDVIFLQLDDSIHLSVLLRGALLTQHSRMNVDKMLMPVFSELSHRTAPHLPPNEQAQLLNQVGSAALMRLIDRHLPNTLPHSREKLAFFLHLVEENHPMALAILHHIADNLAYVLMNLINIFSTPKVMISSPLLAVKAPLFARLQSQLAQHLLNDALVVDLVTSQYEWNSPVIPSIAIKEGIYHGDLIQNIIS